MQNTPLCVCVCVICVCVWNEITIIHYIIKLWKFRSQTSDNMDRWKAEMGRVGEKRRGQERRSEKRKSQKKEDAGARKGKKIESKSRRAKQMRDEKLHAVVARSTFRSQNVQNTPGSDHFWKLRCPKKCTPLWREARFEVKMYKTHQVRTTFGSWDVQKSARRCGAKHVSKSKCTKHARSGPLLEVEMSKKCTPLWHEVHFEVKMYKTPHLRATFGSWDVEKVHAIVARSTFRSQNVQNTTCSRHLWTFRCRFAWQAQGIVHLVKSEQNVKVLWHFQKRWQAWDIWRISAKMHFARQAQYKRHVHQRC